MATKNKKKKPGKSKKTRPSKPAAKRQLAKKVPQAKKRNKLAPKKSAARAAASKSKSKPNKPRVRGKREDVDSVVFEPKGLGARSGGQSGDLQGLSNRGGADSESVDELLEEGNAFEAEAVKGVEDAPDADEGEVHTHEVPEDDVPEEYLEKDE
ncbi:MAG: hypothetical protein WA621_10575 [Candidatus Acidiferrum sp.]|jgi:hypothetical protein